MARPRKQTVDYFPHDSDASEGATLTILQHQFGNDGYAFWFRLLEHLARSPGHVSDCRNPTRLEFLGAKTHLSPDLTEKLLQKLADLEAIDPELWAHRIIWCQNLVNRVADVYRNRQDPIPLKPSLTDQKPTPALVSTPGNTTSALVSTPDNAQSKVKESKVKESKVKEITPPPPTPLADTSASPLSFEGWLIKIRNNGNKTSSLGELYEFLKGEKPDFARLGSILKKDFHDDAGFLAKCLWQASAQRPAGDLLSYVQGMAKKKGATHGAVDVGPWDTGEAPGKKV